MGTFSPELGISQPTPGDPAVANVWGTILNTNFGLIDSAVAGLISLSVAGSSNVVLTNTNGAADQERNAIFIFTGALTGNINVLYPNGKTKVFSVENSTSGAFTLSLGVNNGSGSPAGSVAVVAAGGSGTFYSDGTNVFNLSISANNPTFTGTLTGPGAGTWTSGNIQGLNSVAIGYTGTPQTAIDVQDPTNTSTIGRVFNGSSGAVATARWRAENDATHVIDMTLGGSGNTVGTAFVGNNLAALATDAPNGLNIGTSVNALVRVYVNNGFNSCFASDGSFLVGSTTPAGTGAIAATGNVTAFYSDDRLKTRQGNIEGALSKVMSLQGFYYGPNDTAKALGYDYKREVGLSAQDVQKVMPEVVAPAPIDHQYMTLRYEKLVPLLVEAIKELKAEIEELKAKANS